jgi:hypothetical protein
MHAPIPDPERSALKEWEVLVDAMARGDIVAMVRKGGIREQRAGFSVRHERFLLYPTFFHEKQAELAERFRDRLATSSRERPPEGMLRLAYVAEVMAVWSVADLEALRTVGGMHGLAWSAVESRFHYKQRPGVQVIAVRTLALPRPVDIPEVRRYGGCVSWVELDDAVDVSPARPVLEDAELSRRVATLEAALGSPVEQAG